MNSLIIIIMLGICGLILFNTFPYIDFFFAKFFVKNNIFYLRNNWYLDKLFHEYLKYLIIFLVIFNYIFIFYKYYEPYKYTQYKKDVKKYFIFSLLITILIPLSISVLKQISVHACPWDLALYGGNMPYVSWWGNDAIYGKCFPAGHATTGLCILGIGLFYEKIKLNNLANIFYILGIVLGVILGLTQQIRGAHFLSHTLASIYLAWLIIVCAKKLIK